MTITETDKKMVSLLAEGKSTQEMSDILKTPLRTIETRLSKLRKKATARNSPHLVSIFLRNKIIL